MTKTDAVKITPFDPWAGIPLHLENAQRNALHPAERPPAYWPELRPLEREMLGGIAFHVLNVHGPLSDISGPRGRLRFVQARLIEALHARHMADEVRGGYGDDLRPYYERDDEQRALWRRLDLKLQGPNLGVNLLRDVLEGLAAAGDLEQTLLARRAAIDVQIERLRGRGGLAATIRERAADDHVALDKLRDGTAG